MDKQLEELMQKMQDDQFEADLRTFARALYAYFNELVGAGFCEEDAYELLRDYHRMAVAHTLSAKFGQIGE